MTVEVSQSNLEKHFLFILLVAKLLLISIIQSKSLDFPPIVVSNYPYHNFLKIAAKTDQYIPYIR